MTHALKLEGMHAQTNSTAGWIFTTDGPSCMFCNQPAGAFKPTTTAAVWWCQPCDTTWVEHPGRKS